jgi:Tfp pilus assembly protein PilZ
MLIHDDVTIGCDELSAVLGLGQGVIKALVESGAVRTVRRDGREVVAPAQLEALFRDALMRLYRAQATRTAPLGEAVQPAVAQAVTAEPVAAGEEEVVITRTVDEYVTVPRERPDMRLAARYIPRKQIGGVFRQAKFIVLQLSNDGLRIRHDEPLRPGEEARLSLALMTPPKSFVMKAKVVWTSIAQRDDTSFCISGLTVVGSTDALASAIEVLRNARELHLDDSGRRRNTAMPKPVTGLPDEDVVDIIRAVRKFASDPVEAMRWYNRARFAVADEEVRRVAPRGAREREEVLGVWEYLHRRIDLKAVTGVVQWIRSSNAAAT